MSGAAFEIPNELRHVLVILPTWVGDFVMATPLLRAIRERFDGAWITFLAVPNLVGVIEDGPWMDEVAVWPTKGEGGGIDAFLSLAGRLRAKRFDLAVLLTNSFRSALVAWLGRVGRRAGYARDGRSLLLTDRLRPIKKNGCYVAGPMLQYYMTLAERVGCPIENTKLELGVTPEQERGGEELKSHYGFGSDRPYAVINPGAAFGAAKCWLPERFAEVCDRVSDERGWQPVVVGAASEAPLMREIVRLASSEVICCDDPGTTLGSLKPIIRDAALLVCNDTGPRHYGNAFDVPTVTVFGSTYQAWTNTDYAGETKLQVEVECGPCMLRTCPLDHRCMKGVTADNVMGAVGSLVADVGASSPRRETGPLNTKM
ncbi:MAG: lipopolysaccharide heptosyltransferase II [Planctomycetes bacterium]|nr:lipopolysaccharide heptosyltransferase II [Planctomycetota bacterium]